MFNAQDTPICTIQDTDDSSVIKNSRQIPYSTRFKYFYSYILKEGATDLDGMKTRNSDDNSLKNKTELYCNKLKYDDWLRVLQGTKRILHILSS